MAIFKLPQVIAATGLGKSTIYVMTKAGQFPSAIRLSKKLVAWNSDDIDAWIKSREKVTTIHA